MKVSAIEVHRGVGGIDTTPLSMAAREMVGTDVLTLDLFGCPL
jgi:hypothetical protein